MASLMDIAPSHRTVLVRGTDVEVTGVGVSGLTHLIGRFQGMEGLLDGGLSVASIQAMGPEFVAAVIAAGTGSPGDAKAEAVAAKLPLHDQIGLLSAIIEETMPAGVGEFGARVVGLARSLGAAPSPEPSNT